MPKIGRHTTPGMKRAAWGFMQSGDFPVPVGYWKFGENTGIEAKDSSPEGNDGTIEGASWTTGYLGPGLSFDGLDNYVDCGDDASMQPASTITIITSVYIDIDLDTTDMDDYCQFLYVAGGVFIRYRAGSKRISGYVRLAVAGNKFMNHVITKSGWYEIVVTFDGENYITYINAVVVASGSVAADTIDYPATNVYMGGIAGANSFKGIVDQSLIFDEVFTAAQVRQWHKGVR